MVKKCVGIFMLSMVLFANIPVTSLANEMDGATIESDDVSSAVKNELNVIGEEKDKAVEHDLIGELLKKRYKPMGEADPILGETNLKNDRDEYQICRNPDGVYYGINVTLNKQEKKYYCGPAAARQALSFHKQKSNAKAALPSQLALAAKIGTEKLKASSSHAIASALNSYQKTYSFTANPYGVGKLHGFDDPRDKFEGRIIYCLSKKINAPILLVQTKYLPKYKGAVSRHYITVAAYCREERTNDRQIKYEDPHFDNRYYGEAWCEIGTQNSQTGVFRACWAAEEGGSNPVMIF